jgi:carbon monoxide dehydrogenase subunit G
MDLHGEYRVPAPPQQVWAALNDPEALQACIPGCKRLEKTSETTFASVVISKVGPITATFNGTVTLSDLDPPRGYTIIGDGQGGAAGFARLSAHVKLVEDGTDTLLRYDAKVDVGGKLAAVGSRLVQTVANKNVEDFFGAFAQRLGGSGRQEPVEAATAVAGATPPPSSTPTATRWLLVGAAIVAAVLLYLLLRH